MRKNTPSPSTKSPALRLRTEREPTEFTAGEMREIFKRMVVAELEAGFLRYSRRQALLDYSSKLGIAEFEACLLIAEAQYHAGDIEPIHFDATVPIDPLDRPAGWPIPVKVGFVAAMALLADLLVIHWLFG